MSNVSCFSNGPVEGAYGSQHSPVSRSDASTEDAELSAALAHQHHLAMQVCTIHTRFIRRCRIENVRTILCDPNDSQRVGNHSLYRDMLLDKNFLTDFKQEVVFNFSALYLWVYHCNFFIFTIIMR